jgi:hypothetical protein
MKRLIICALLCVVPFVGVRVVCFNAETAARQRAVLRQQPPSASDECERICSRAHRVQPPPSHATCALVANPTCGFLMDATVAVMPPPAPALVPLPVSPIAAGPHDSYAAPPLGQLTPPPRA